MTTDTTQWHIPSSESERKLQVNIIGIKNKLEEHKLLIHDTHTYIITIQETKLVNNTTHITIANMYLSPRDSTSTHYKTDDTDIHHNIQYITNIPHSVLTGYVNAHPTLWHSYTDAHREQLIADVISNSDHITLNTNTPTRVTNTTLQQTSSPGITKVSNTFYMRCGGIARFTRVLFELPC